MSDDYARLGQALRQIREGAAKKTHQVPKGDGSFFGSGHVSNVERGHTAPSENFIKAYVGFGGDYAVLTAMLDRAKKPRPRQLVAENQIADQFIDPRTDPLLLRRGYVVDRQEDLVQIDEHRVPRRLTYSVTIRPVVPSAKYFVFRYGYEDDPRRGVARVKAGAGCWIALAEEADDGVWYVVLEFDSSKADELGRCKFSWSISVDSSEPMKPQDEITYGRRLLML